jgi:hypothetical protein
MRPFGVTQLISFSTLDRKCRWMDVIDIVLGQDPLDIQVPHYPSLYCPSLAFIFARRAPAPLLSTSVSTSESPHLRPANCSLTSLHCHLICQRIMHAPEWFSPLIHQLTTPRRLEYRAEQRHRDREWNGGLSILRNRGYFACDSAIFVAVNGIATMFSSKYSRQTGKGQGFLESWRGTQGVAPPPFESLEQLDISSGSHIET